MSIRLCMCLCFRVLLHEGIKVGEATNLLQFPLNSKPALIRTPRSGNRGWGYGIHSILTNLSCCMVSNCSFFWVCVSVDPSVDAHVTLACGLDFVFTMVCWGHAPALSLFVLGHKECDSTSVPPYCLLSSETRNWSFSAYLAILSSLFIIKHVP